MLLLLILLLLMHVATCSSPPMLLVISMDGFRHDYFSRVDVPTLKSLMNNGVYAPRVKNVFVTKTMPNHYSISTGLYVESHGLVANFIYDPDLKKSMNPFKEADAFTTNTMGEPIWNLNEKAGNGRCSGGMMWPGTPFEINGFNISHVQEFNDSTPYKEKMDRVVEWFQDTERPANLVMMYFNQPDHTGHHYGPDSVEVKEEIEKVDRALGYLLRKLQTADVLRNLNIMVVSDHGMEATSVDDFVDLTKILDNTTYDYYSSSPVLLIEPRKGFKKAVYGNLTTAASKSKFTVYLKENIPEEWHYRNNRRIQSILLVSNLGYSFKVTESDKLLLGSHGWNNSFPEMNTFFIGYGPAFKQGVVMDDVLNLVDIYPLMCYVLDLTPAVHNGSLSNVAHLLREPPSWFANLFEDRVILGVAVAVLFVVTILITTLCILRYNQRRSYEATETPFGMGTVFRRLSEEEGVDRGRFEEEGDEEEHAQLLLTSSPDEQ